MKTKNYTIYSGDCPPIQHLSSKPFPNNASTNGTTNELTNGNISNGHDDAEEDPSTDMLQEPGGDDLVTLENPPQGLVNFPVNQGNQPKLILRFEKGKAKPVVPGFKKHTSFADKVSNIFGIGNSSKKANVIAYSETPIDVFKLLNDNDDFDSSDASARSIQEMKRRYQNIRLENRMLFMSTKVIYANNENCVGLYSAITSSTLQVIVHFHFCRQKRARKAMEQSPKTTKQIMPLVERRDTWWQIFA